MVIELNFGNWSWQLAIPDCISGLNLPILPANSTGGLIMILCDNAIIVVIGRFGGHELRNGG